MQRFLPIANVARIMKRCLPVNAKISKDAKECVQECVSEFISFITSEAQEHCMTEKRKTINGEDILHAMGSLGFENYCPAVGIYLAKYREVRMTISLIHGYLLLINKHMKQLLKAQPPNKSKSSASRRDPLPRSHEEDLDVPLTGQMVESDDGASVDGVTDAESDGEP